MRGVRDAGLKLAFTCWTACCGRIRRRQCRSEWTTRQMHLAVIVTWRYSVLDPACMARRVGNQRSCTMYGVELGFATAPIRVALILFYPSSMAKRFIVRNYPQPCPHWMNSLEWMASPRQCRRSLIDHDPNADETCSGLYPSRRT